MPEATAPELETRAAPASSAKSLNIGTMRTEQLRVQRDSATPVLLQWGRRQASAGIVYQRCAGPIGSTQGSCARVRMIPTPNF
jgi:hypothetical protein